MRPSAGPCFRSLYWTLRYEGPQRVSYISHSLITYQKRGLKTHQTSNTLTLNPKPLDSLHCKQLLNPHDSFLLTRGTAQRNISTISTFLIPPIAFSGLLVTLWCYKSLMLILFQNKIIYMPFFPPGARQETISTYEKACRPVLWREERIKAKDGTDLALCIGELPSSNKLEKTGKISYRRIKVLYFQGNAGSIPSRLPYLSDILRQLQHNPTMPPNITYNIVALSYRGYWTSRGRATQRGIILDAEAALRHVSSTSETSTQVVLWGQSIGAGVACEALAKYFQGIEVGSDGLGDKYLEVSGLILETPFTSVKDMLVAIYPQRWLPYRYLYPFLRNKWDSVSALKSVATNFQGARHRLTRPNPTNGPKNGSETPATNGLEVLIVRAGNDELVPYGHTDKLEELCRTLGMDVRRTVVPGALHAECMIRARGRDAVVEFLRSAEDQPK